MTQECKIALLALFSAVCSLPVPGVADMEAPDLSRLVEQSTRVVRGRVQLAETALETVPLNPHGDVAKIVFTYVELEPTEHLVGEPVSRLTFRLIGGRLGASAVVYDEAPAVQSGEDVLLFLRPSRVPRSSTGEPVYFVPHARYGKFGVTTVDGVLTASRSVSNRSLGPIDGVDAESQSVPLQDLRTLVAQEARALGGPD